MIRHIEFSEKATEELYQQLADAGEGRRLRIIPKSDDGLALKFYATVRGGVHAEKGEEDCPPVLNDSHICPPQCP